MENAKLFRLFSALALLVVVLNWGDTALVAQQKLDASTPAAQLRHHPDTTNQQGTNAMGQPDVATFAGKIMKSGDKLVLEDSIGESTYELDDQKNAKPFEGKNVKVTGTVDVVTNTIGVAEIRPEP